MNEMITVPYLPMWRRYVEVFEDAQLTNAQIGKLTRMMMEYQFRGKEPEQVPRALGVLWNFVKKDLDDSRRQYMNCVLNGKKGGRPGKNQRKPKTNPDETQNNPEKPISISMSKTMSESRSESMSTTNTMSGGWDRSAPAGEAAGVGGEKVSYGEFGWIKLSWIQYQDLAERMGIEELNRCITYMDELTQSTGNRNHWKDWYLMLRRCHERQWHISPRSQSREVPCGATGELGQAELEAIRQLMAEDGVGEQGL